MYWIKLYIDVEINVVKHFGHRISQLVGPGWQTESVMVESLDVTKLVLLEPNHNNIGNGGIGWGDQSG
jgi:hypothetical protein